MCHKAIASATGRTADAIKADLKKEGDLGLVAMVRFLNFFAMLLMLTCVP